MKRYFTTATNPLQSGYHCQSAFHFVALPGGYTICMMNGDFDPDPSWTEMPHLLEAKAAGFNGVTATLGAAVPAAFSATAPLASISATDTTYQVAKKLAGVHPLFHP